jgi:hypothetical protein
MSYVLVCLAAAGASLLTFLSGFGLGTLLLPVYALFFPLPVAVGATAVVHLANNLFKLGLMWRFTRPRVVLRFGVPAALAAVAGAWLLLRLAALPPLLSYELAGRGLEVAPLALVLAVLIAVFALLDLLPAFENLSFDSRALGLGGALSGFFGGLSGHQGALRAAFLSKADLDRDAFVATGIVCAVLVDAVRLVVYGVGFFAEHFATLEAAGGGELVLASTLAAFAGAWIGRRLLHRMTLRRVQRLVGVLLLALALGIGSGVL